MKFSVIAFLTIIVIGCSKDDDSKKDNNNAADGEFIAKIDGNEFKASTQVVATFYAGTFNITAIQPSTGETISITVSYAQEGIFELSSNTLNSAFYKINDQLLYNSHWGSGHIKITELDVVNKTVSGTFSFTATRNIFTNNGLITETVVITEGAFKNITLSTTITGNGDSFVEAEIENNDLDADSITAVEIITSGNSTITLTATNNTTYQNLSLSFPGDITPGTYDFSSGPYSSDLIGQYNPNLNGGTSNYVSEDGTLTILTYDTNSRKIEGTFRFTAERLDPDDPPITYNILGGRFFVQIQ
ncbi:MAG: DUF6252 family protein [Aequorivita sp.]|nr:DUF6252 family protein [Aequorivita sp.]